MKLLFINKYKFLIMVLLLTVVVEANEENSYGWNVPNSSLNIGGYVDATYDTQRNPKFLFDDIAMLLSANKNSFDFLSEIEFSHISLDGKSNNSRDVSLNIERLQLSYALSNEQIFRVGRFNTEIGFWNLAPIPILEDTTTKPHFLGNIFPRYTIGGMFEQKIDESNRVSLSLQKSKDFLHKGSSVESDRHLLLSYYGEDDDLSWNVAVGNYEDEKENNFNYAGLSTQYLADDFGVQAELYIQSSSVGYSMPYSGYLQGTWHFTEQQDVVSRIERYRDNGQNVSEAIYLFGYVYRPTNNMALKAEYINHSILPLNHFVYSISVLF